MRAIAGDGISVMASAEFGWSGLFVRRTGDVWVAGVTLRPKPVSVKQYELRLNCELLARTQTPGAHNRNQLKWNGMRACHTLIILFEVDLVMLSCEHKELWHENLEIVFGGFGILDYVAARRNMSRVDSIFLPNISIPFHLISVLLVVYSNLFLYDYYYFTLYSIQIYNICMMQSTGMLWVLLLLYAYCHKNSGMPPKMCWFSSS